MVVEVLPLDARRRLVLVRRDATEHLLLLGAERDLVVEAGPAAQGAGAPAAEAPGRSHEPPARPGEAAGGRRTAAGTAPALLGLILVAAPGARRP